MKKLALLMLVIFCHGCGSESSNVKEIWYSEANDEYLVLGQDNSIEIRNCTLNDGYQSAGFWPQLVNEFYLVDGSTEQVVFEDRGHEPRIFDLSRAGSRVQLNFDNTELIYDTYEVVDKVATTCDGDAFEIESLAPVVFEQGDSVVVTVRMNYRLKTVEQFEVDVSLASYSESQVSTSFITTEFDLLKTEQEYTATFRFDWSVNYLNGEQQFLIIEAHPFTKIQYVPITVNR